MDSPTLIIAGLGIGAAVRSLGDPLLTREALNDLGVRQFQEAAVERIRRLLLDHGLPEPAFERHENEEFSDLAAQFHHMGHGYDLSIQEEEISLVADRKHYSCEMAAGYPDRWALLNDFTALLDRLLKGGRANREVRSKRGIGGRIRKIFGGR